MTARSPPCSQALVWVLHQSPAWCTLLLPSSLPRQAIPPRRLCPRFPKVPGPDTPSQHSSHPLGHLWFQKQCEPPSLPGIPPLIDILGAPGHTAPPLSTTCASPTPAPPCLLSARFQPLLLATLCSKRRQRRSWLAWPEREAQWKKETPVTWADCRRGGHPRCTPFVIE